LTQEYIAQMLGVRRTSVTVVARTLQEAGIRYSRGHIKLIDIPALQETACECYQTVNSTTTRCCSRINSRSPVAGA
jgi:hypothetical protein